MGIDYSYEVYVHRDSARALLETVKAHCFQWRGQFTLVEFPDGTVEMPCTPDRKALWPRAIRSGPQRTSPDRYFCSCVPISVARPMAFMNRLKPR